MSQDDQAIEIAAQAIRDVLLRRLGPRMQGGKSWLALPAKLRFEHIEEARAAIAAYKAAGGR